MKSILKLGLITLVLFSCEREGSELEKLKGVWEVASVRERIEQKGTFVKGMSGVPTLEIIDDTRCYLSLFGIKDKGTMFIDQETRTIKMDWNATEITLTYNPEVKEIKMAAQGFVFTKISSKATEAAVSATSLELDEGDLFGRWYLTEQSEEETSDFLLKNFGACYNFLPNDQLEITYPDGKMTRGLYYVKEGNTVLLALNDKLSRYTFSSKTSRTIQLDGQEGLEGLTLERRIDNVQHAPRESVPREPKKVNSVENHEEKYARLRKKVVDNFDVYIQDLDGRTTANQVAIKKIKEDFTFIKNAGTLQEFIESCPRIEEGLVEEYLQGLEMILRSFS